MLEQSHKAVMNSIKKFSDVQLFTKQIFTRANTSTLGSYFVSTAASHYDWAIKKIKKQIKLLTI